MANPHVSSPREAVDSYHASLDARTRRVLGSHPTPSALAHRLVSMTADAAPRSLRVICDPSCGGGAILLAAAEHLMQSGMHPAEVIGTALIGADIDPTAVETARRVLVSWARDNGVRNPAPPRVVLGDALDGAALGELCDEPIGAVIGNPPFLSQLSADTAFDPARRAELKDRFGDLGSYTDAAALHLLAAVELIEANGVDCGVVCMLQPQSVLGSRDSTDVRATITMRGDLAALWASDELLFDAGVRVCAPVLVFPRSPRNRVGRHSTDQVKVMWREAGAISVAHPPGDGSSWSPLLAAASGVPVLFGPDTHGAGPADGPEVPTLAEVADVTAGFRDEFYALAEVCSDLEGEGVDAAPVPQRVDAGSPRLVTVGMIDLGHISWGERPRRLAGRTVLEPIADMEALATRSARVAAWAAQRLVPKVLVASQTRIIEAAVDAVGDMIPVTPVVSVEARGEVTPWMLAAALSAPSNSVRLAIATAGTGRSGRAMRVGSAQLRALPVPRDTQAWREVAQQWSELTAKRVVDADGVSELLCWSRLGQELDGLLGVSDEDVISWWLERLPAALPAPSPEPWL